MLQDDAGCLLVCTGEHWVNAEPRLRPVSGAAGDGFGMAVDCTVNRPDVAPGCVTRHTIWLAATPSGSIEVGERPYAWDRAVAAFAALDAWKAQERIKRTQAERRGIAG